MLKRVLFLLIDMVLNDNLILAGGNPNFVKQAIIDNKALVSKLVEHLMETDLQNN